MNKKIIYIIFTLFSMLLIFNFSNENNTSSNNLSKGLIDKSIKVYENITKTKIDNRKVIKKINYPVRKVAHYTIYLLLGFSIYNLLLLTNIKYKEITTIILGTLYALTDEFHQLFIGGRTGQFIDVLIDMLGIISIVLLLKKVNHLKNKV